MNHMIKEIKYRGFTASPSDYESPDGELAALIGLVPEEGNLKPILPPKALFQVTGGKIIRFIHETSAFRHYIILDPATNYVYWTEDGNTLNTIATLPSQPSHITALGNTLMAFTPDGIYYYLYKDGSYINLGNHIPDLQLSFCLTGIPTLYSQTNSDKPFTVNFDSVSNIYDTFTEDNQTKITTQVMARLNKFIAEQVTDKGHFCFPFFVRYALRLFDGSLVSHSAPILMNPGTTAGPVVLWKRATGSNSYTSADLDIFAMPSILSFRWMPTLQCTSTDLLAWKDIIKSIDIYVSKPIYPYDQSGKIKSFADSDNLKSRFIGKIHPLQRPKSSNATCSKTDGNHDYSLYAAEWEYSRLYALFKTSDYIYPNTTVNLPEFENDKQTEYTAATHLFYKIASVPFSTLKEDGEYYLEKDVYTFIFLVGNKAAVPCEDLRTLVTHEAMTDDYLTHDRIYAAASYPYNSRINLASIRRQPYRGFTAQAMFARCERTYSWTQSGNSLNVTFNTLSNDPFQIDVYINEGGHTYKVTSAMDYTSGSLYLAPYIKRSDTTYAHFGAYLYYPNTNAFKMIIHNGSKPIYAAELKPHDHLNGAYKYIGYLDRSDNTYGNIPSYTEPDYTGDLAAVNFPIPATNKIYTSEVNNPFYFPVLGINTVGTGTILGLSTAAKALSQGQFGQFPLYAFTTEGIWALEVSSTGGYSAKQPITRDVCINANSITQLDSAVLFATDRGIMLISGSNSQCISDVLDYSQVFDISSLPHAEELVALAGFNTEHFNYVPFTEFLLGCRMIYAYTQQRVIVYNPEHSYAYVYSLKTNTWGMMLSTIADNLQSYPEALAMLKDGTLVDFCTDAAQQEDENGHLQGIKGLLVTRPLKLDAQDLLKTIDAAIQRGNFRKGSVKSALYGSRDLQNWILIWTSQDHYLRGLRGTPYKYFRFALICDMQPYESLFGATVQYTHRLINKPR